MYEKLIRRKVELEEEFEIIAQQKYELSEKFEFIRKSLKDKEKELENKAREIDDVLAQMENVKLQLKQQKAEKAETDKKVTAKKIEDLANVLSTKSFYKSVRKHMPEPHWKKLTKAIRSDEFFTFILKHHYANRVIKAYKNDAEINQAIMEAIVSKLKTLIK